MEETQSCLLRFKLLVISFKTLIKSMETEITKTKLEYDLLREQNGDIQYSGVVVICNAIKKFTPSTHHNVMREKSQH